MSCLNFPELLQDHPEPLALCKTVIYPPALTEASPHNMSGVFQGNLTPSAPVALSDDPVSGQFCWVRPSAQAVPLGTSVLPTALLAQQLPDIGVTAPSCSRRCCCHSEYCSPCPGSAPFPAGLHVTSICSCPARQSRSMPVTVVQGP